jgi:hypothetical protein
MFKSFFSSHCASTNIEAKSPAIELIVQSDRKLKLNPQALARIRELKGDIAVCLCIGQYRSGKSFLLSRIVENFTNKSEGRGHVFQVDHGQDSFTKGCWMNSDIPKILIGNKHVNVLFIDTEVRAIGSFKNTRRFLKLVSKNRALSQQVTARNGTTNCLCLVY